MLKTIMVAGLALVTLPAVAQIAIVPAPITNQRVPTVVNPGGPGAENSGPGATGSIATGATGADTISNNPAGAGNAQSPSRASSTPSGNGATQ